MAYNGATPNVFQRLYNWVQDKANAIKINATRMDAEFDGIATALSLCLLRDGSQQVSGDLPMNTHKLTGMAAGSARGDSSRVAEIQDSTFIYGGTSTGTDTVAITTAPVITAYVIGQRFQFKAGGTNTTATTLNVDAVGAGAVQKLGAALVAADITAGDIVDVEVSATTPVFQMLSPARTPVLAAGAVTGSGKIVKDTSPTLVTPILGAATATSIAFGHEAMTDYDEVTFTPAFVPGAGAVTHDFQVGDAIRIGNAVHITGLLGLSATTGTGTLTISGLPFTAVNSNAQPAVACNPRSTWAASLTTALVGVVAKNTTTISMYKYGATGGTITTNIANDLSATCRMEFSATYLLV